MLIKSGFVLFCWDNTQGYLSTFQGLDFGIQGLFDRKQTNLLMCKLNILIKIAVSVVDECLHGFKFVQKLAICGVPDV